MKNDGIDPDFRTGEHIERLMGSVSNHSIKNEHLSTRIVTLVDVAMMGMAAFEPERDWDLPITVLEVVLLTAIVLAVLVALDYLN